MAACEKGFKEVVGILLKAGADGNFQGCYRNNALVCAAEGRHFHLIHMLLDAGAVFNDGGEADPALAYALEEEEWLPVFLDGGAPPCWDGAVGRYTIVKAPIIKRLLQAVACPSELINNPWGATLLSVAVNMTDERVMCLMLAVGGDIYSMEAIDHTIEY
jgi:ankyrin repeat protein